MEKRESHFLWKFHVLVQAVYLVTPVGVFGDASWSHHKGPPHRHPTSVRTRLHVLKALSPTECASEAACDGVRWRHVTFGWRMGRWEEALSPTPTSAHHSQRPQKHHAHPDPRRKLRAANENTVRFLKAAGAFCIGVVGIIQMLRYYSLYYDKGLPVDCKCQARYSVPLADSLTKAGFDIPPVW